MTETKRFTGISASTGYAEGPIFRLSSAVRSYQRAGSAPEEAEALVSAIAMASRRIAELAAVSSGEAADMLEFQLAMLSDDTLSGQALAAIDGGAAADVAWAAALNEEIGGYEAAEDEYFRARATDLKDIRDQVLESLASSGESTAPDGAILVGEDLAPTRFLATDWSRGGGIALTGGSPASHVAMLARSQGVPMIVGLGGIPSDLGGAALLDAERGTLLIDAAPEETALFRSAAKRHADRRHRAEECLGRPAVTANGIPVRVQVNIADPADTDRIDIANCDGVGLMRSEFLFGKAGGMPDEDIQYNAYSRVLRWAQGKPVTIRTVDAGGDKPVPGFTVEDSNPFLGLRGIRLSLARPDVFRVQIRALLRAAVHGKLKVMFPMISVPEEYRQAAALFTEEAQKLAVSGIDHAMPPLGIMVEVPTVAVAPELFSNVAFFSIGSNDLTQYVMAAARDNASVARLNSPTNTAVLRLIETVTAFGASKGISVSLCGDAGGDPKAIPHLLRAGLRDFSVAPAQLAVAKSAIAEATA